MPLIDMTPGIIFVLILLLILISLHRLKAFSCFSNMEWSNIGGKQVSTGACPEIFSSWLNAKTQDHTSPRTSWAIQSVARWAVSPSFCVPGGKREFPFQMTVSPSVFCKSLPFQGFVKITDLSAMAWARWSGYHFGFFLCSLVCGSNRTSLTPATCLTQHNAQ